jgi:chitinase
MSRDDRAHKNSFRLLRLSISVVLCFCTLFSAAQESKEALRPIVVGYFLGENIRKRFFVKNLLSNGDISLLDQINYSQGRISGNTCTIADPYADLNYNFSVDNSVDGTPDTAGLPFRGNFHQLLELKRLYPHIKILISIEGNAEAFAEAAQPANRHTFVASCIQRFIKGKFTEGVISPGLFDGIDIDWEYPQEVDKFNFIALLGEFRRQLNSAGPNLLLTVAMGDNRITYRHLDMPAVAFYTDEVGVMNYDYSGPWSKKTGLIAPLYSSPGDPEIGNDVDSTIRGYEAVGVPAAKMLLGLPFYAYSWNLVAQENHGLFQLGEASRTDLPYNYITTILPRFTVYRDPKSMAPWLFDGSTFWTYDDELSISKKVKYANQQDLGGVMIWELSGDTPDGKLLKTVSEQLNDRDSDQDAGDNDDGEDSTAATR